MAEFSTISLKMPNSVDEIITAMKEKPNFQNIIVTNCKFSSDALKFLADAKFKDVFSKSPQAVAISFECYDSLGQITEPKVQAIDFNAGRPIVIGFVSDSSRKFSVFWRFSDNRHFSTDKTFSGDSDIVKGFHFVMDALAACAKSSSKAFSSTRNAGEKVALKELVDSEGFDLLISAARANDLEAVKFFVMSIDPNPPKRADMSDHETAMRAAFRHENPAICFELLKAGSMFPDFIKPSTLRKMRDENKELNELMGIIEELHKFVRDVEREEDIDALLKYMVDKEQFTKLSSDCQHFCDCLRKSNSLEFCFDTHNESLAARALKSGKFKVFKVISHYGMSYGPHESKEAQAILKKIRGENIENTEIPTETKHNIFVMRSRLKHNQSITPEQSTTLLKVFEYLRTIPETKIILDIVADCGDFKLIFDTTKNDVSGVVIENNERTLGTIFWEDREIIVGAKSLFDGATMAAICKENAAFETILAERSERSRKIAQVIGTLMHELAHYAMLIVWRNSCMPFSLGCDAEFSQVIEATKRVIEAERFEETTDEFRVVGSVFRYYSSLAWSAELIVRPVQLYVEFAHDRPRLDEIKGKFPKLFEHFEENTRSVMEGSREIVRKLADKKCVVSYADLTDALKTTVKKSSVDLQGCLVKIGSVVDDSGLSSLTTDEIHEILNGIDPMTVVSRPSKPIGQLIDRKFVRESDGKVFDVADLAAHAAKERMVVLQDEAGHGQTTTWNFIESHLKELGEQYRDCWSVRIDGKSFDRLDEGLAEKEDICGFLVETVLRMDRSSFKAKVFENRFEAGKVWLFWENFEIAEVSKVLTMVQKDTQNVQLVTAKPNDSVAAFGAQNVFRYTKRTQSDVKQLIDNIRLDERQKFEASISGKKKQKIK